MTDLTDEQIDKILSEDFTVDAIFESCPILMSLSGEKGRFRRVSRSWEVLTGYTQKELTGRPFYDFIHPDDIEETEELYSRGEVFDSSIPPVISFINRYITKSGDVVKLEWFSSGVTSNGLSLGLAIPRQ